jgi:hypothetical protein
MPKRKSDVSPIFESFIREVLGCFAYLIQEFGFEHAETLISGHECMITFRRVHRVAVTVAYDAGAVPWVMLTGNTGTPKRYRTEELPLDVLVAKRCPDRLRAMPEAFPLGEDVVRDVLRYYAAALRDCAKDILDGEVAAFGELRRAVDAEYARRNRALKKEEAKHQGRSTRP